MTSVFANMDYLFQRLPDDHQDDTFPWIIWKSRNDKVFKNLDRKPQKVLQLAEQKVAIWEAAQEVSQSPAHDWEGLVTTNPENMGFYVTLVGHGKTLIYFHV